MSTAVPSENRTLFLTKLLDYTAIHFVYLSECYYCFSIRSCWVLGKAVKGMMIEGEGKSWPEVSGGTSYALNMRP